MARSVFDTEVKREMARLLESYLLNNKDTGNLVRNGLRSLFQETWQSNIKEMLMEVAAETLQILHPDSIRLVTERYLDEAIGKKLQNKTVWQASEQDAYIRRVAREEMKRAFSDS
jgi:ABC-type Fe3+-citrate transport system substrate-binding protein